MRKTTAAALAVFLFPGLAYAAPVASRLGPAAPSPDPAPAVGDAAPAPAPAADGAVRIAMRKETLPPGGQLPEHRSAGERYLYVVAGELKVSDLVTGEEQLVEAGKMAAEHPGDWHVAKAMGREPVTLYVIDRTPAAVAAATAAVQASAGGN